MEVPQVARYEGGQFYGAHYDSGEVRTQAWRRLPQGDRVVEG